MTFNEKIDKYMVENNISTLKQFSLNANIPYTTLRDFYEKKSADNSRLSTIRKLAEYMNCTMDYLSYEDVLEKNEVKLDGIDLNDYENDKNNPDREYISRFKVTIDKKKDVMNFLNKNKIKYEISEPATNNRLNILYDKIKDLPEDKQQMIANVTEAIMKDIDKQIDGEE